MFQCYWGFQGKKLQKLPFNERLLKKNNHSLYRRHDRSWACWGVVLNTELRYREAEELSTLNNQTGKVSLSGRDEASIHLPHVIRLPILNYPLLTRQGAYSWYWQQRQLASSHLSAAETCWVSVSGRANIKIKQHWNNQTNKINFSFILSNFSTFITCLHMCVSIKSTLIATVILFFKILFPRDSY